MGEHLVGIDVGTTGTKTAVFDTDLNLVASAFRDSRLYQPLPGIVEEDPEFMYRCVCETIAEALANGRVDPGSVKAVAMDGQMAGIMGIDADWHPVTPYDSWLDTRCAPYIAQMRERAGEAVTRSTGCAPTFAHGPKILWWRNERPEVYARVAKWVVPSAYLAGRLAGLKADEAYLDYTQHHFSGFGDVLAGAWNDELSRLFEVDSAKLPQVVAPWRVIGGVTTEAAADTGLTRGTPIMAGAGDQSAGSLGAGITSAGMIFDCAGTASVFSCSTQHFTPSVTTGTFISARSILPGLWVPLAYINGGGLCVRWFRDTFGTSGDPAWYGQLETEARDIPPGSEGLLFLPHFGGRVCPSDPEVRGAWLGLNWRHGRAHLYRAILEGIAYEYAFYLNELHSSCPNRSSPRRESSAAEPRVRSLTRSRPTS